MLSGDHGAVMLCQKWRRKAKTEKIDKAKEKKSSSRISQINADKRNK